MLPSFANLVTEALPLDQHRIMFSKKVLQRAFSWVRWA